MCAFATPASPRGKGAAPRPRRLNQQAASVMPDLNEFGDEDAAHIAKIQAACRGKNTRREMRSRMNEQQIQKLDNAQDLANQRRELYSDVQNLLGVSRVDFSVRPSLQTAHEYLSKHRILDLMKILCAHVALERPADMRERLIELLEEMKSQRGQPSMGMITREDLDTMFTMWDKHTLGEISPADTVACLEALGCGKNARSAVEKALAGRGENAAAAKRNMVDRNTFMDICVQEVEAFFMPPKLPS